MEIRENYLESDDWSIKNTELHDFYKDGTYQFRMGIYSMDQRYPRILAKENENFSDEVEFRLKNGESFFLMKPVKNQAKKVLWYMEQGKWIQAQKRNQSFLLPGTVFTYTMSGAVPIMECDGLIALTDGNFEPEETECRELNIHLW